MKHERPVQRFWRMTAKGPDPAECWIWLGSRATHRGGYGQFSVEHGTVVRAHRWLYERLVGPIPDGHHLHHTCETPMCVNPSHLVPCSPAQHFRLTESPALQRSRQTHCVRGHLLNDANTYLRPDTGHRMCRECRRIRNRDDKARRRDAQNEVM